MRTFDNYQQVRDAFVEGEITRKEFEQLARNMDGLEMLAVEAKHGWLTKVFKSILKK